MLSAIARIDGMTSIPQLLGNNRIQPDKCNDAGNEDDAEYNDIVEANILLKVKYKFF